MLFDATVLRYPYPTRQPASVPACRGGRCGGAGKLGKAGACVLPVNRKVMKGRGHDLAQRSGVSLSCLTSLSHTPTLSISAAQLYFSSFPSSTSPAA